MSTVENTSRMGNRRWAVGFGLLLCVGLAHLLQRQEASVLEQEGGWRWIKPGSGLETPEYYNHPLANFDIDPYRDFPRATERGLPDIRQAYDVRMLSPPVQTAGMKTVFSQSRATNDLEVMKEFGLVDDQQYAKKQKQIESASRDPFMKRERLPQPGEPEGWTGPSKMCRDITTHSAGLSRQGWAQLNTLRCCSYLCSKEQWQALRVGQLKGAHRVTGTYSAAIDTGSTSVMADGSQRLLCRTCAWYKEPQFDNLWNVGSDAANSTDSADANV